MKKYLFIVCIFFPNFCIAGTPAITEVRSLYKHAVSKKASCEQLIKLLEPYNEKNNPLLFGYKACGTMIMAKHVINPFSKLSYFKKGVKMLERAIEADPQNVELIYLRFTVQMNAPSFLDYNKNIKSDKIFLQKSLASLNDAALKEMIVSYFKKSSKK